MTRRSSVASGLDADTALRFQRDVIPLLDPLFTGALRLTGDRNDAQDLVQQTVLNAYAGFHQFREGTNLRAWLYRIMHNTWINLYRVKQRRPHEVSSEHLTEKSFLVDVRYAGGALRSAEVVVLESLADHEITAALMSLSEEQRIAVYYADVEGFSYREIATIMGTCEGTVMSRLHRGRGRLRVALSSVATRRRLVRAPEAS